jgi:hypothetical protein
VYEFSLRRDPVVQRVAAALEDWALSEHITHGPYPEYAAGHLDVVKRAIFLCASGMSRGRVPVDDVEIEAAVLVAVLGLEDFVFARLRARFN